MVRLLRRDNYLFYGLCIYFFHVLHMVGRNLRTEDFNVIYQVAFKSLYMHRRNTDHGRWGGRVFRGLWFVVCGLLVLRCLVFHGRERPFTYQNGPCLFVANVINLQPVKSVIIARNASAGKRLSYRFSQERNVRLQVIISFSVGRKLSREVLTCNPMRLFRASIRRFLILRRISTSNNKLSIKGVSNNVTIRGIRPRKRAFRMILFIRLCSSFGLFHMRFLNVNEKGRVRNMRINNVLVFLYVMGAT